MAVRKVINGCIKALGQGKPTTGFETAMTEIVTECIREDIFFQLPIEVALRIFSDVDEDLSMEDIETILKGFGETNGVVSIILITALKCSNMTFQGALKCLEPYRNCDIIKAIYKAPNVKEVIVKREVDSPNSSEEVQTKTAKPDEIKQKDRTIRKLMKTAEKYRNQLVDIERQYSAGDTKWLIKKKEREIQAERNRVDALEKQLEAARGLMDVELPEGLNIIDAVKTGNIEAVKYFVIEDPENLEVHDVEWESTPLHWAAGWGKLEILKFLIDCGSDIESRNKLGSTPLLMAALDGQLDCVKELVARGADILASDNEGFTALHFAADQGHIDIIKFLTMKGADLNAVTKDGGTVLWVSAASGNEQVFNFFYRDCKMDINHAANGNDTVLHQAAIGGNLRIIKACLKAGIDINSRTNEGYTAIQYTEDERIRDYLISKGCVPE